MENNHEANNKSTVSEQTGSASTRYLDHSGKLLTRQQWIGDELLKTYLAMDKPRPAMEVMAIMASDLAEELSDEQIAQGLSRLRKEREWVSVKAIIELSGRSIDDDGRPSVEIAWAMCPRSEEVSVVWTSEMAEAFEFSRKVLMDGDEVAARMVFKEQYQQVVARARASRAPVRWEPSLGWDQADRVRALFEAIAKGRIEAKRALGLLGPAQQQELMQQLPAATQKLLTGNVSAPRSQPTVLQEVCSEVIVRMPKMPTVPRYPEQTDEERAAHARRVREQAARWRKPAEPESKTGA